MTTHPALANLTLAEIHERGARARRMSLPYFGCNPFLHDDTAKVSAWWAGWLRGRRGGRDKHVQAHLHGGPRFK